MRVKSHQLPMTMRRATDPRMESFPEVKGKYPPPNQTHRQDCHTHMVFAPTHNTHAHTHTTHTVYPYIVHTYSHTHAHAHTHTLTHTHTHTLEGCVGREVCMHLKIKMKNAFLKILYFDYFTIQHTLSH